MTPSDLLRRLALDASCTEAYYRRRHAGTPGEIIARLPEHERAILRRLTSDDAANVRDARMIVTVEPPPAPWGYTPPSWTSERGAS